MANEPEQQQEQPAEDNSWGGWLRNGLRRAWDNTGGRVGRALENAGQQVENAAMGYIGKTVGNFLIMILEAVKGFFGGGNAQTMGNGGAGVKFINELEDGIRNTFGADPALAATAPQRQPVQAPAPAAPTVQ